SRDRHERPAHRLRRRPAAQGVAPPSRGRPPLSRALSLLVVALAVAAGVTDVRRPRGPRARPAVSETEEGLKFRLFEGEGGAAAPRGAVAAAAPLSDADTARGLERLPPLPAAPDEEQAFALREGSLPPPRAGHTVKDPFPPGARPTEAPVRADAGPLTVL